ncbi:MAG: hypothetical protein Q7T54_06490 [Candidatus Levybacteria bacterium]|nr:hypothetical protein [Candidatus Levybacteria bacterium]
MNRIIVVIFILIFGLFAVLLETTLIGIPLVYLVGSFCLIFIRRIRVYILVFILAFFIDSLRVSHFGFTSFFMLAICMITFIYEKYSGSDDVIISSFLIAVSGIIYAHVLSYSVGNTVMFIGVLAFLWYLFSSLQRKGRLFI